ncbi:hypothetical protein [Culicoidibacter larvae]|uniref:DUF4352 domain-containing protein n=1 Tax=Culicoidibacter larvae TaxID=2579976 RepID=A0A5R8QAH9_9FIRM|nr:hypothetical protein [Culicoidibacter larvae]TLG72890.1 hypothetical protein FEZ08_07535 [Culicoidibacter larvae]
MLKKFKAIFLAGFLLLGLTACSSDLLGGGSVDYSALSSMASSPASSSALSQDETVTFTAFMISDPYETTVDNVPKTYIDVMIARNPDKPIYVDVTDITVPTKSGDIISVTGKVDGYLYWTEEGTTEEALNILGESIVLNEPTGAENVASGSYTTEDNITYTFDKAVYADNTMYENEGYIYVYYYVDNKSGSMASGRLDSVFYLFRGDNELNNTFAMFADIEHPSNAENFSMTGFVKEGQKIYGYNSFTAEGEGPLEITVYDDDFNVVFSQELPVE